MDDEEYEAELSTIDCLSESDVLDFLKRHHHEWATCDFCSELVTDDGSIVMHLLYQYRNTGTIIPSKVVEAMCSATVGHIAEADFAHGDGPPMSELIWLTKLPECTPSLYEDVIYGFSPRWYNEQRWTLEDVKAFVLERAGLPNAPADFAKRATDAFHGCWHAGPVEACYECQDVIRQANGTS